MFDTLEIERYQFRLGLLILHQIAAVVGLFLFAGVAAFCISPYSSPFWLILQQVLVWTSGGLLGLLGQHLLPSPGKEGRWVWILPVVILVVAAGCDLSNHTLRSVIGKLFWQ